MNWKVWLKITKPECNKWIFTWKNQYLRSNISLTIFGKISLLYFHFSCWLYIKIESRKRVFNLMRHYNFYWVKFCIYEHLTLRDESRLIWPSRLISVHVQTIKKTECDIDNKTLSFRLFTASYMFLDIGVYKSLHRLCNIVLTDIFQL